MKRKTTVTLATFAGVMLLASSAWAHHAMEYIEMESYNTAGQGEYVFHVHFDYMVDDADNPQADHWEFTPGLSYGLTPKLMLDVHTHFAKFGEEHIVEEEKANYETIGSSPFMEAVAGSLQYRLTEDWLIDIAIAGTIEIPFSRAKQLLGSEDNVYVGTLILSKDLGEHGNLCVNITYEEEGDEDSTSWAIGAKHPISADTHGIAAGIEVMGDFDGDVWSVLPGIYAPLGDEGIILKTGLEFGQEKTAAGTVDTIRASTALMYRF
jgi:hypothetical protein